MSLLSTFNDSFFLWRSWNAFFLCRLAALQDGHSWKTIVLLEQSSSRFIRQKMILLIHTPFFFEILSTFHLNV